MRVLALDVGSSSVKAACWDGRRTVAPVRVSFRTQFDGVKAEVSPHALLRAVMRAGAQACNGAGDVDAVAFCAFSSGVVVADARGRWLTPIITHADRRSVATAARLVHEKPRRWWLDRTGNLPYPGGIGSSTLAHWLSHGATERRRAGPAQKRFAGKVGQVSTLVGWWLTGGEWVIDPSNAVFLGLYDVRRGGWAEDVCGVVGISPACLPRIAFADSVIGRLGASVARHWGLRNGLPIVGGLVDTGATLLQTPLEPGQLVHSCGTTDVLAMCLDVPAPEEGILTRPIGVGAVYPERWLAVRTNASAGSALQWLRGTCFRETDDLGWQRLLRQAVHRLGEQGLPECVPAFAGARAAIEQPNGASFSRLHLGTTREDLVCALMRALVQESAASYRRLVRIHQPLRPVHISGGASILGDAMHRAWPVGCVSGGEKHGSHVFRRLSGETLKGLVILARKVLQTTVKA